MKELKAYFWETYDLRWTRLHKKGYPIKGENKG